MAIAATVPPAEGQHASVTLDESFGSGGITAPAIPGNARAVARQSDGKIVVVGDGAGGVWAIARYTSDGVLDPSFSEDGWLTVDFGDGQDYARAVAIQSDGAIIVGGEVATPTWRDFGLIRLLPNGSLDPSFSGDGKAVFPIGSNVQNNEILSRIELQDDGKILAIGTNVSRSWVVLRVNADGALDISYGDMGKVELDRGGSYWCFASALQADGKLILGGSVPAASNLHRQCALRRLTTTGELDTSFGDAGWARWDAAPGTRGEDVHSITIDGLGRIVATGTAGTDNPAVSDKTNEDYLVFRLTSSGAFDPSFSGDGRLIIPVESAAGSTQAGNKSGPFCVVRPDEKILLGGWFPSGTPGKSTWCLARLTSGGDLDVTFSETGFRTAPQGEDHDTLYGLIQEPGGRVLGPVLDGHFRVSRAIVDPDSDGDGLDDASEHAWGTLPDNPDTDNDGLTDGDEVLIHRTDPLDTDTDDDGLLDGPEVLTHGSSPLLPDTDDDGLDDEEEVVVWGTNPARTDTDGDGLSDAYETSTVGFDPLDPDMDDDGLKDGEEVLTFQSDPLNPDSDDDGFLDGYERDTGHSPTNAASKPAALMTIHRAVELEVVTKLGIDYRVQVSDDLETWVDTEITVTGTGGSVRDIFERASELPGRYWRVREE